MIGKVISSFQIRKINKFIIVHGEKAFTDAVWHHAFREVSEAYIHPNETMKKTKNFTTIQKAFINAYTKTN